MAKPSKKKKKSLSRNSIITIIACVSVVVVLLGFVTSNLIKLAESKAELDKKDAILTEYENKNEDLKDDIENGNNLSYIEKWARELGFAYPNERVHVDGTPDGNN